MGELEDKEFAILLEERRHKEVITLLTKLYTELSKPGQEKDIIVDTSKMEKIIRTINTKEDSSIPKSIKIIGDAIIKKIDSKKEKIPSEWVHDIDRDNNGLAKTIISKVTKYEEK